MHTFGFFLQSLWTHTEENKKQVKWLGFQRNPFSFMRAADCFALSSWTEGGPNVVLETLLCGTPVIATRCAQALSERVIDGMTGELVPLGDVQAFGSALERLANDAKLLRHMKSKCRPHMLQKLKHENVYGSYEDLFEATVRRNVVWSPNAHDARHQA